MGTTEQYLIVNSPKKAGNGFFNFISSLYLSSSSILSTLWRTHPPGDANSGSRSRLRLNTKSAATTFLVLPFPKVFDL